MDLCNAVPNEGVPESLKIAYLTAGAAGMFCGSCMNDNAVARALNRLGHDCVLVPVYTPIRTDEEDISVDKVFLGGVNVYLQQKFSWFGKLPRAVDAFLNAPWLIRWLTKNAGKTSPKLLGALAVSMLEGYRGQQHKEFERLVAWLKSDIKPDRVLLTNLLIGGCIPQLRESLQADVFVTLQGDDIFLDSLPDVNRKRCIELMRGLVPGVAGFIVHSKAYGAKMGALLGIPDEDIHVVPLGIAASDFSTWGAREPIGIKRGRPPSYTIGYLARMAPEKGLHQIVDGFIALCERRPDIRYVLRLAGWMGPQHQAFWAEQQRKLKAAGLDGRWDYTGAVDRTGKMEFLSSLDLFCVPTTYAEPKGLFLLEAAALGLKYVAPDHGAFPELHQRLQHGWLYQHDSMSDLIGTLEQACDTRPARENPSDRTLREIDIETHAERLWRVLNA